MSTTLSIGSMCTGYGGLELGLGLLGPVQTAWVSDVEPGPRAVLDVRFPGVPNLGDITTVNWEKVEPVDVVAGGPDAVSCAGCVRGQAVRVAEAAGRLGRIADRLRAVWGDAA
ncbi:MAG: hypothetical protein Q4C85_07100 [Actinomyces sp.]|uniref:hypothetical protein n=1 Tax=Actinomyces sp. TaxID=29317 RepID=UPI0026DB3555|nr:hypothetical protein [Actinomyces sp.]MDO4243509.1 hypothetical protein [Actinomyces sp.]